ncbi:hypothetical protein ACIOKD_15600 [Streptomyces sp. NPDC087844]|uniref:hypothetical protein n=1 Tax=Streptomyces sp. NPDC087844 TaxID=3365805 RepID=UPI00381DD587
MSAERRIHRARTAATVVLIVSAVLIGVLAPQAAAARTAARTPRSVPAAPSALPVPLPVTAVEPLVTEGVGIEGPLINNITLPTLK